VTSYDNEKKLKQKQKKEEEPNVMAKEEEKRKNGERPSHFNGPLSPMNEPSQARVPTEIGPVAGTKKQPVNRPGELLFLCSHPIAVCKSFIFY